MQRTEKFKVKLGNPGGIWRGKYPIAFYEDWTKREIKKVKLLLSYRVEHIHTRWDTNVT
jgi:hypothetical protein